jgi:hypothetical protein
MREHCVGPLNREFVIENILDSPLLCPHFPQFHFRPQEAQIYARMVQNLKEDLNEVKGVHSAEELAYKGAILNSVVGGRIKVGQISRYSRILGTHHANIRRAAMRRESTVQEGSSLWRLPTRKPRPGFSGNTVELIVARWTMETCISPNKKEMTRNRIGPNEHEEHPTHYLCETQVCAFLTINLCIVGWFVPRTIGRGLDCVHCDQPCLHHCVCTCMWFL